MKKSFNKPGSANNPFKPGQQKSNIHLPFSSSSSDNNDKKGPQYNPDPKKTQIGRQPDFPFSSKPGDKSDQGGQNCPKCGYPLRTRPASSSPCPNCGFTGDDNNTVSDSGKTKPVISLAEEIQEFRFNLVKEVNNSEIKIESADENEIMLNRSHLDPENDTISSDKHVIFRYKNKIIYIEDVSSNGSTFIQAKNKLPLEPGSRIVIGNKIMLFKTSGSISQNDQTKSTRKFGEFDLNGNQADSGFTLINEKTGQQVNYNGSSIIINRSNLDPGNNTISSTQHAEIENSENQWYIKDLSSNDSTFVQLKGELPLENKIRIILGDQIFRFEHS